MVLIQTPTLHFTGTLQEPLNHVHYTTPLISRSPIGKSYFENIICSTRSFRDGDGRNILHCM